MNAQERIVEAYYRMVKKCFTVTDVKLPHGNNRQIDILAYEAIKDQYYHIEVEVTHCKNWSKNLDEIKERFAYKFFGIPENKRPENPNTDASKGKTYLKETQEAYKMYGIDFKKIIRVWCSWIFKKSDEENIKMLKRELAKKYNLTPKEFELVSFRDDVLHELKAYVGTSNYDDEIVRTLSLLDQYEKQTKTSE